MKARKKSPSEARLERQQVYNVAREAGKTMMQAADEAGVGALDTARKYEVQYNSSSKEVISRKQLLVQLSTLLKSPVTPITAKIGIANLIVKMQGYGHEPPEETDEPTADLQAFIEELQPDEPVDPRDPPALPDVPIVMTDDDKEH